VGRENCPHRLFSSLSVQDFLTPRTLKKSCVDRDTQADVLGKIYMLDTSVQSRLRGQAPRRFCAIVVVVARRG
jgi:hypothetical protein